MFPLPQYGIFLTCFFLRIFISWFCRHIFVPNARPITGMGEVLAREARRVVLALVLLPARKTKFSL